MASRSERTGTALAVGLRRGTASHRRLLVYRGQNDEALFVCLHKAIHRLVLILVIADLLPDAGEVEADRRVADHHFKAQLANFLQEVLYLARTCLVAVVDRQSLLNRIRQLREEVIAQARLHDLAPVRLVSLAQHALHRAVKHGQAADLLQDLFGWCEVLLNGHHDGWEAVLIEVDDTFEVELGTQ